MRLIFRAKIQISSLRKRDDDSLAHPFKPSNGSIIALHSYRPAAKATYRQICPPRGTTLKNLTQTKDENTPNVTVTVVQAEFVYNVHEEQTDIWTRAERSQVFPFLGVGRSTIFIRISQSIL